MVLCFIITLEKLYLELVLEYIIGEYHGENKTK